MWVVDLGQQDRRNLLSRCDVIKSKISTRKIARQLWAICSFSLICILISSELISLPFTCFPFAYPFRSKVRNLGQQESVPWLTTRRQRGCRRRKARRQSRMQLGSLAHKAGLGKYTLRRYRWVPFVTVPRGRCERRHALARTARITVTDASGGRHQRSRTC